MGSLEPIINLLTVLVVLSVGAERVTNVIKLRRDQYWKTLPEEKRALRILLSNMAVGIGFALSVKADLFGMLAQPNAPWSTLGWTTWNGTAWVEHAALGTTAGVLQSIFGSILTGTALGFGSQFWHDVLEIVLETKRQSEARSLNAKQAAIAQAVTTEKIVAEVAALKKGVAP